MSIIELKNNRYLNIPSSKMLSIYERTKPEEAIINFLKRHGYTTETKKSIAYEDLEKAVIRPDKGLGSHIFRELDLNGGNLEAVLQSLVRRNHVKQTPVENPLLFQQMLGKTYYTYSLQVFPKKQSKKKNKYRYEPDPF